MSTFADLVSSVQAIADDLAAEVTLPPHKLELYRTPPAITPEHCPLLVVAFGTLAWTLLATPSHYIGRPEIRVSWHVAIPKQTETLGTDLGVVVKAALDQNDAIVSRLFTYSEGLPWHDDGDLQPPSPASGTFGQLMDSAPDTASHAGVLGIVHRLEVER